MFLIWLVFVLVLALTFGTFLVVTRPTAAERVIDVRITRLHDGPACSGLLDAADGIVKQTRFSEIPWLDALLRRCRPVAAIQQLIVQAESFWSVTGVLVTSVALGIGGFAIGYYEFASAGLALLPGTVLAVTPFLVLRYQRARRLKEFNRHLPDAIDLMSRALRAGHSLTAAIDIVSEEAAEPLRSEFREVYRQQNFGLPLREALAQLAHRIPLPELHFLITAILLQKETGGNLVEVLERTTAVIRERLRVEGEIRIYAAQGRFTGWILSLLPIAMFFLLSFANHGYTRVLIDDATGRKLIYTGLGLMVVGGLAIRHIVRVKL